jgi:toxin ParE1/3/4
MQLCITPMAIQDLEDIGDYIAMDNPLRAISFLDELRLHCQKICLNPEGYRKRSDLGEDIRSCSHDKYVIFFQIQDQVVNVIRILHSARSQPLS